MIKAVTLLSHAYNIWRMKVVQGLCNSARNAWFQSIVFVVDLVLTLPSFQVAQSSLSKKHAVTVCDYYCHIR